MGTVIRFITLNAGGAPVADFVAAHVTAASSTPGIDAVVISIQERAYRDKGRLEQLLSGWSGRLQLVTHEHTKCCLLGITNFSTSLIVFSESGVIVQEPGRPVQTLHHNQLESKTTIMCPLRVRGIPAVIVGSHLPFLADEERGDEAAVMAVVKELQLMVGNPEWIVWLGDLNFRHSKTPGGPEQLSQQIARGLLTVRNASFVDLTTPDRIQPTCKVSFPRTTPFSYDIKRVPSNCDRVLWWGKGGLMPWVKFYVVDPQVSDHLGVVVDVAIPPILPYRYREQQFHAGGMRSPPKAARRRKNNSPAPKI